MINFFTEDVNEIKIKKRIISSWIKSCIEKSENKCGNINIIFCSDEYLKEMNIQYLDHHYYTDIITFNYNEKDTISGDIYISTDRVADNAGLFKVDFYNELLRVIIHGILHLTGSDDETEEKKEIMRKEEDFWLNEYQKFK